MVLKNLFTGQQWRNRHREQTYGHGERAGEGEIYGKSNMETFTTRCKKIRQPVEICSMSQGTQTGALYQVEAWDGEGDGGRLEREGTYVHLWLIHVEV